MRKWLNEWQTRFSLAKRALSGDRFAPPPLRVGRIASVMRRTCTIRPKPERGVVGLHRAITPMLGRGVSIEQKEVLVSIHVTAPMEYHGSWMGCPPTESHKRLLPGDCLDLRLTAYGIEASVKEAPRG